MCVINVISPYRSEHNYIDVFCVCVVQLYKIPHVYVYTQIELDHANKKDNTPTIWEGHLMAARERERETHRLLGMAPPTFHLSYGLAVNFMGELLVVMTETTGIDLPTAGGLSVCVCVCGVHVIRGYVWHSTPS